MEFGVIDVSGVEPNVACGAILWRYGGTLRATIIAKATFDLVHDLPMTLRAPEELQKRDRHVGNNPARSVHIASDAVPYRPRADVTFVGHACAPSSGPVPAVFVRFALYRDAMILERTLHVYGDRDVTGDVVPWKRMPIVPERALAGPDNPVGIPQPNILDARGPSMSAWLGPISRFWRSRTQLLRGGKAPPTTPILDVPNDLDWSYFQAAPNEQQVSYLRGDEWIVLDGVNANLPRLKTQLPLVRARAMVHVASAPLGGLLGPGHPLELVTDGLAVDGDHMTASLTFRGSFPMENESLVPRLKVLVGLELGGAAIRWPALETIPLPHPVEPSKDAPRPALTETQTLENRGAASDPASAIPFHQAPPSAVVSSPDGSSKLFDVPQELEGTFMLSASESMSLGAGGVIDDGEPTTVGEAPGVTPRHNQDPRSSG